MRKAIDLKEFMEETYQGDQILAVHIGFGKDLKTNLIVWKSAVCPISFNPPNNTSRVRIYRWLWFELNVPKKEANSRYLQLNINRVNDERR